MARIRTIKPEFFTSEQVMNLDRDARLAFIGLWNFCDDGGNHPASAKTLKAEVFPSDELTTADVQALVDQMLRERLLETYVVGPKPFWHVTGWSRHQRIDRPTIKHPAPPDASPPEGRPFATKSTQPRRNGDDPTHIDLQPIAEASTSARRVRLDQSTPEGNGEEGNRDEGKSAPSEQRPMGASEVIVAVRGYAEAAVTDVLEQVAVMDRKAGAPLLAEDEKLLWRAGKQLFELAGVNNDAAGRFIGKLIKDCSNDRVLVFDALHAACLERPLDPRGWLTATCQRLCGDRAPANKQAALEKRALEAADRWAAAHAANDLHVAPLIPTENLIA
ncbi:MAG: hypothetical protein EOO27_08740 [Comamonadaceae bacterium]|nr:MAG: hypothetical protein EOO27_08740 [Comamonadaceae bacterium]